MRQRTTLTEDQTGRKKLKVSLPGGRYQLSLDDAADSLLCNDLELQVGDAVPEPLVPILVATRDAWFPRQQDTEEVVADLPTGGSLKSKQRSAVINYLKSTRVNPRDESLIIEVVANSPVADVIDETDLNVASLPDIPDGIDMGGDSIAADTTSTESPTSGSEVDQPDASDQSSEQVHQDVQQIPGIGDHRAKPLVENGFTTASKIAESRPADIAEITGLSETMATVAVEGARELVGSTTPTEERLASRTGVDANRFVGALSSLAASGVPPSEAAPVLEALYGPTVAEIDSVSGQQAYYLWSSGYQTPGDVARAEVDDLCEVPYIGKNSASEIIEDAGSIT